MPFFPYGLTTRPPFFQHIACRTCAHVHYGAASEKLYPLEPRYLTPLAPSHPCHAAAIAAWSIASVGICDAVLGLKPGLLAP